MITSTPVDGDLVFANSGKVKSKGVELQIDSQTASGYSYYIGSHYDFAFKIYNLFDKINHMPVSSSYTQDVIPQAGRTFYFQATQHF